MIIKKNVESSNIEFKQQEVGIDTVFTRFDEEKLYDEDGVHVGWRYNEIWEDKDEFLERVSKENQQLKEDLEKAKQKDLMSSFAVIQLDSKILELEEKLNEFSK